MFLRKQCGWVVGAKGQVWQTGSAGRLEVEENRGQLGGSLWVSRLYHGTLNHVELDLGQENQKVLRPRFRNDTKSVHQFIKQLILTI